jgi:hypothetical protein
MKRRLLTSFAVVPLISAVLAVLAVLTLRTASPAGPTPGTHAITSVYLASARQPVPVEVAASVSAPAKHAADAFGSLAGAMVAASAAVFAGTAMVRRRKGVQR